MRHTLVGRLLEVAEATEIANSTLMKLRFIFTDFKPNRNKVVVPPAEAENIMASAIFMPIKIDFNDGPEGHPNSLPIGLITSIEQLEDQLVGNALMWREEFPHVAQWIDENKDNETVQFSWELWTDPEASEELDDSGNRILRGIEVKSTVIVDNPAYAGRTRLLTVASEDSAIHRLVGTVNELSQEIKKLKEEAMEKDNAEETPAEVVETPAEVEVSDESSPDTSDTPATNETDTLLQELEALRAFKAEIEQRAQRATKLAERASTLSSAGVTVPAEKFTAREEFYLALSDEHFAMYVDDLCSVLQASSSKPASTDVVESSTSKNIVIPEPITSMGGQTPITVKSLAKELRSFGREFRS